MAHPARVLVIDDSRIYRQVLHELFGHIPDVEISAMVDTAVAALAALQIEVPDVVLLDVGLAARDEFGLLQQIRHDWPDLPIIAVDLPTVDRCRLMNRALALGAVDSVPKPAIMGHVERVMNDLRSRLVPRVQFWARWRHAELLAPHGAPLGDRLRGRLGKDWGEAVEAVAIGVGQGGARSLTSLLAMLPEPPRVPILVVHPRPATFLKLLAVQLASTCRYGVAIAHRPGPLEAGQAWIAPAHAHLTVGGSAREPRLELHTGPPVHGHRPARPRAPAGHRSAIYQLGQSIRSRGTRHPPIR